MYHLSRNLTNFNDISSFFDNDFFNSSVIYQIPSTLEDTLVLSHKLREDLISLDAYGSQNYLGMILLDLGSTVIKSEDKVIPSPEYKPLDKVSVTNLNELRSSQLVSATSNTLTSKEISVIRRPESERYKYSSKRFQPETESE